MYSVGFLVAYLTVLLIVAEPLRNAGKYTMADILAYRLRPRPVRAAASLSTLTVSIFYMIAQMVGAGTLVRQLIPGVSYEVAVVGVGILMVVYVVFGGVLATTWVQITKAILLPVPASQAGAADLLTDRLDSQRSRAGAESYGMRRSAAGSRLFASARSSSSSRS